MEHDSRYFIEALHRGLRILEVFSEETPELTLAEIVEAVGLDKSTAFRFVYTLQTLGYLERDPESKRYRPGLQVLKMGFTALNSLDVAQLARPYLKGLSEKTDEATNMALRDGAEIVYVVRISPMQLVHINLHVGSRLPAHCTSMGKALLAGLPREQVRALLGEGPYEALTPKTITSLDELIVELDQVGRQGYAVSDEELVIGARSLAAPLRQTDGDTIAAINICVSSARLSRQEMEDRFARPVVESAKRISTALGGRV
ncbi:MAG: IclR family transcriptional regulator C-terminal domain-containing protein [Candidatus Promineifilaceae bacterium]|nr:IclR family transcriptional regulator C-terminal domain-containing protein [Candidatus Promineifilaceae bacterium]